MQRLGRRTGRPIRRAAPRRLPATIRWCAASSPVSAARLMAARPPRRHHGRLPAGAGRAGAGRPRHDRRPGLWRGSRDGRACSAGGGRGPARPAASCRSSSTCPGMAAPRADSHTALPVVDGLARRAGGARFRAVPDAGGPADGDDGPCGLRGDRSGRARRLRPEIVFREIIRGAIGFDGLLMSDDLSMKALSGIVRRAGLRGAHGGLRHGAPLQRRAGRDARGSPRPAPGSRGARRTGGGRADAHPAWRRAARSCGSRARLDRGLAAPA